MRQSAAAFAALLALALAAPAFGKRAAPLPPGFRAANADIVVVGQVTDVSATAEKAELYKGDPRQMKVATVKVQAALLGTPGSTTVKVGFVVAQPNGGRPGRFPMVSLTRGQEACFFLSKHPSKKGVYVVNSTDDVIDKAGNTAWKQEIDDVKKAAKVLASPMAALKSKDASERLTAAALLINRYKSPSAGVEKTELVPAAQSKLILTALAEADWANTRGGNYMTNPQGLFFRLGATAKDGWQQPRDFNLIAGEAQKWLKANAGKFKMTRYVREKLSTEPSVEPDQ